MSAADGAPEIGPGVVLGGKYEVRRVLGAGAVGVVYEAVNIELDEKVAVKCLLPEMLGDPAMVARFAREAKSAAAIKCEYVATVHDVGVHDNGAPFIVMEYLEGKDLEVLLGEVGRLEARTAVEYTLQICEALAVAHAREIVHRDLKPANLLITERVGGMQIVKVLDFGISKAALTGSIFGEELPVVNTQNLMGTPLYMSPEQVRCSDEVDARADVWSVGLVLYEMLSGDTPFGGAAITEVCAAILESRPKPLDLHRTDLPPGLITVIDKCLEKDPAKRYQTVAELALDLLPFGPKRSRLNVERAVAVLKSAGKLDPSIEVQSMAPGSTSESVELASSRIPPMPKVPVLATLASAGSAPADVASPPSSHEGAASEKKSHRGLAIAVAVAVVAAVVVALALRSSSDEPTPPTAKASPEPAAPVTAIEVSTAAPEPAATPDTPADDAPTEHANEPTRPAKAAPKAAAPLARPVERPATRGAAATPRTAAPPKTVAPPKATASAQAPTQAAPPPPAKPKAPVSPEEPDLGY